MEPPSNIGIVSPRHPDPELAKQPAKWFIGKFAKIAFSAIVAGEPTKEWMWVRVTSAKDGRCFGALDNDPVFTDVVECGDAVSFSPADVTEVCE